MPRSGRGGRRTGKVGTNYANRSDLRNPTVPNVPVPGQAYGEATAQRAAMSAVPISGAPVIAPGAASPVTAPGGNPAAAPPPPTVGLPPGVPPPGTLPPLDAPTDRPDEHLMTGVDAGPGPGSEALQPIIKQPLIEGVAALNALGSNVSPQLKALRDVVNATIANQSAA